MIYSASIFVLIVRCFPLNSFVTEAADLLQNLSLDSQAKTHDAVEATKKVVFFPSISLGDHRLHLLYGCAVLYFRDRLVLIFIGFCIYTKDGVNFFFLFLNLVNSLLRFNLGLQMVKCPTFRSRQSGR